MRKSLHSLKGPIQTRKSYDDILSIMCLNVNVDKTRVLIFNEAGRLRKESFNFNGEYLECVQYYHYLGIFFSPSGYFHCSIQDLDQKASKRSFKLTKLTASAYPNIVTSIHLYDHLIKPIVLYASEIWSTFTNK